MTKVKSFISLFFMWSLTIFHSALSVKKIVGSLSNSGYFLCVRHPCVSPCDNPMLAHGVVLWGRPTQWSSPCLFVKYRAGRFLWLQHGTVRGCFSPALLAHMSSVTGEWVTAPTVCGRLVRHEAMVRIQEVRCLLQNCQLQRQVSQKQFSKPVQ